jgi:hypothetical protein
VSLYAVYAGMYYDQSRTKREFDARLWFKSGSPFLVAIPLIAVFEACVDGLGRAIVLWASGYVTTFGAMYAGAWLQRDARRRLS